MSPCNQLLKPCKCDLAFIKEQPERRRMGAGWSDEVPSVERSCRVGALNTEHSGVIPTLHAP